MSIGEILKKLSEPIPQELIRTRRQAGIDISYVEWFTVADRLDQVCPDWSGRITRLDTVGDMVLVGYAITIAGETRESFGFEPLASRGFGGAVIKAERNGMKRAAALFGVARELYKDDDDDHGNSFSSPASSAAKSAVKATPANSTPARRENIKAKIVSVEKRPNWKSEGLTVEVDGKTVYFFLDEHAPSVPEIKQWIGADKFPAECLVDMEKKGQYWNITGFKRAS